MKIIHNVESLDSPASWSRLAQLLGGEGIEAVRNTIRHLRVLNAKSYVLEDPYIDQDYSADFTQFYARTFRAYERYCKRVHFFSDDITSLLQRPLSTDQLSSLGDFAEQTYRGFCVIRPLSTAPIGRTVLQARVAGRFNMGGHHNLPGRLRCSPSWHQTASHRHILSSTGYPCRCLRSGRNLGRNAAYARTI